MEVSGEVADLVVKEGLEATEAAVKLTATGMKNVAALLLAINRGDYQVVGKTNSKRLAREEYPPVVIPIKKDDLSTFKRLAGKNGYGILYCVVKSRRGGDGYVNVISNQRFAAKLNAAMEDLGYPIPAREEAAPTKKVQTRVPRERSSPERGNGLNPQRTDTTAEKSTVKSRLEALKAASEQTRSAPVRQKDTKIR